MSRLRGSSIEALGLLAMLASCGGAAVDAPDGAAQTDPDASCALARVEDPDFATSTGWTALGGATIAAGGASFDTRTMCAHGGILQTLSTPALSCARPLVLSVDLDLDDEDQLGFVAGLGGGWSQPVLHIGAQTLQLCVGARAFGGSADLFLGTGNNPWLCPAPASGGPTLSVTRVSLDADVAGTCPLPGTIPNGDFERGAERWTLSPRGGTAEIVAGLGEGATVGAHVAADQLCTIPSISGTASLPTADMLPNPALRIWSRGTSGELASVRIGPLAPNFSTGAQYLLGSDAPVVTDVCIPRWAQGTVQPLAFALVATQLTELCASQRLRDFVFDGLMFVSDAACAAGASVFDPGFEQIAVAPSATVFWALDRYEDNPGSDVRLVIDAAGAHTGNVAAVLSATTPCLNARLSGAVTVPIPAADGGPALKFWYETTASAHTQLGVSMAALPAGLTLPPSTTWTQATACLDPALASRPDLLSFALVSGGGTCADAFPLETASVDDVALTTDTSCPTR